MTGPEHYLEAERLLGAAREPSNESHADRLTATAHVHAVLAHTSAVVEADGGISVAWQRAVYGEQFTH